MINIVLWDSNTCSVVFADGSWIATVETFERSLKTPLQIKTSQVNDQRITRDYRRLSFSKSKLLNFRRHDLSLKGYIYFWSSSSKLMLGDARNKSTVCRKQNVKVLSFKFWFYGLSLSKEIMRSLYYQIIR